MSAPIDAPAITAAALVAWAADGTQTDDDSIAYADGFAAGVAWSARRLLGVLDGERERVEAGT